MISCRSVIYYLKRGERGLHEQPDEIRQGASRILRGSAEDPLGCGGFADLSLTARSSQAYPSNTCHEYISAALLHFLPSLPSLVDVARQSTPSLLPPTPRADYLTRIRLHPRPRSLRQLLLSNLSNRGASAGADFFLVFRQLEAQWVPRMLQRARARVEGGGQR